jgi:hypothetical protein
MSAVARARSVRLTDVERDRLAATLASLEDLEDQGVT